MRRLNSFSPVFNPGDAEMAAFKKAVQQETKIARDLARLKRIIKAQFRREGVSYQGVNPYTRTGSQNLVEKISNPTVRGLVLQNYRRMAHLEEEKAFSRKMLRSFQSKIAVLKELMKVPGLGLVTSARFTAYVQTPHRFSSKRKLWRYARLGVVKRSSDGNPIGRERLDRCANGVLKDVSRKAFQASMLCQEDNLFKRTYRKSLARTENPVHARLNTQRKILAVLFAMWRDGTEYNDNMDRA
jgi:transposase